ncbi:hypothetical protein BJ546DRAFT_198840 [Cryomyces antarcticus]
MLGKATTAMESLVRECSFSWPVRGRLVGGHWRDLGVSATWACRSGQHERSAQRLLRGVASSRGKMGVIVIASGSCTRSVEVERAWRQTLARLVTVNGVLPSPSAVFHFPSCGLLPLLRLLPLLHLLPLLPLLPWRALSCCSAAHFRCCCYVACYFAERAVITSRRIGCQQYNVVSAALLQLPSFHYPIHIRPLSAHDTRPQTLPPKHSRLRETLSDCVRSQG